MSHVLTPHSGSVTSREAARRIAPAAISQVAQVFAFILRQGSEGATDLEIQAELGLSGDSERPRRKALQIAGEIIDSGTTRKSPTGRDSIVWVATTHSKHSTEIAHDGTDATAGAETAQHHQPAGTGSNRATGCCGRQCGGLHFRTGQPADGHERSESETATEAGPTDGQVSEVIPPPANSPPPAPLKSAGPGQLF